GRDLWSGRVTLSVKPFEGLQAYLVWEHFSENDDRMRTAKQLCHTDPIPTEIGGVPVGAGGGGFFSLPSYLSQGCRMSSLYSADAFQVPNGFSLPYYTFLPTHDIDPNLDPYASTTQSRNLRVIESTLTPKYQAKNDVAELNADYSLTPALMLTSQT